MDNKFDPYRNYTSTAMLIGQNEQALTQWSKGYFAANIQPHLPGKKDVRILEIGCGYGRYIKVLQELGYSDVKGIDISKEQIDYAVDKLGLTNVVHGDAAAYLDESDEAYDVILLLDVIEHLELSYSVKLIQSIKAALKPGGVFIVQAPNAMSPLSPNRHWDITHLRAYTTHSMEQHLMLGGFVEMCHFELPPHVHGFASAVRRILWVSFVKPCLSAYMLAANSGLMGGIYTTNILTVCRLRNSSM